MLKINEPMRVVCKSKDCYEFIIMRESKSIEANTEFFEFMKYLREKKEFKAEIINSYLEENNLKTTEEYKECFNDLIKNKVIIPKEIDEVSDN